MIKKIILLIIINCFIISCGKKGDPVYTDSNKKAEIKSTTLNKS